VVHANLHPTGLRPNGGGCDDEVGDEEGVAEVKGLLPRDIRFRRAPHADGRCGIAKRGDLAGRDTKAISVANEARVPPHHIAQLGHERRGSRAPVAPKRFRSQSEHLAGEGVNGRVCTHARGSSALVARERRCAPSREQPEDRRLCDAVAALPCRTVDSAGILAGHEEAWDRRFAIPPDHETADLEVRRGRDLDGLAGEVAARAAGSADKVREQLFDALCAQVSYVDQQGIIRGPASGDEFRVARPDHDVARRALHPHRVVKRQE
jgi:hypothetical protein